MTAVACLYIYHQSYWTVIKEEMVHRSFAELSFMSLLISSGDMTSQNNAEIQEGGSKGKGWYLYENHVNTYIVSGTQMNRNSICSSEKMFELRNKK
jgi:hypothetical protein